MKLSIIVTVYNGEQYLARCIDSLLKQKLEDYEIVIINDGSTDASDSIIQQYQATYPDKICYLAKENGGVSTARNEGIKVSRGEYITYVDCDDYVEENCYRRLYEIAKKKDYDIVIYDMMVVDEKSKRYCEARDGLKEGEISPNEYVLTIPSPCNKIMKRKLFVDHAITFPEGMIYEDFAVIPTLANNACNIYYTKSPYYFYFQSASSIMRNEEYKEKYVDIFKAVKYLANHLERPRFDMEIEFLYYLYILVEASLYFYHYGKEEYLQVTADRMKKEFPNWRKNPYIRKDNRKRKLYAYLFYHKKYTLLKTMQVIKNKFRRTTNDKKNKRIN